MTEKLVFLIQISEEKMNGKGGLLEGCAKY